MNKEQTEYLVHKIDNEGFSYSIDNFTSDIKDKAFVELKKKYQLAKANLLEYIDSCCVKHGVESFDSEWQRSEN